MTTSSATVDDEWTAFMLAQHQSCLSAGINSTKTKTRIGYGGHKAIITVEDDDGGQLDETKDKAKEKDKNNPALLVAATTTTLPPGNSMMTMMMSTQLNYSQVRALSEELYISTKTKVLFLTQPIEIHRIFWELPLVEYWEARDGVIKKQMKVVSKTVDEYEVFRRRMDNLPYYTEHVIRTVNNPNGRTITFLDERKVTIGLSRKDILNCRGKIKNAFYNCFAMIVRFAMAGVFREIHVKVFNTGKLEIPGVINDAILSKVKDIVLAVLRPHMTEELQFRGSSVDENDNCNDNVLINSNFNCGFFINRDKLHAIIRSSPYNIETAYDPCSYPGVKCKFYFNNEIGFKDIERQPGVVLTEDGNMKLSMLSVSKKYTEISFMIFRTGSVLIVGNCSDRVLNFVFEYIRHMLATEYETIHVSTDDPVVKNKKSKLRKRTIRVTNKYFNEIVRRPRKTIDIADINVADIDDDTDDDIDDTQYI